MYLLEVVLINLYLFLEALVPALIQEATVLAVVAVTAVADTAHTAEAATAVDTAPTAAAEATAADSAVDTVAVTVTAAGTPAADITETQDDSPT